MTTKTLDRTRPPAAGRRRPPGFISRWRARRAERDAWAAHHRLAQAVTAEFREACTGLRLCHYVSVAAGVTVRTPRVGEVRVGPPMTFTVELMPGQEPADFTSKENGPRLAHTLGGHGLRVEPLAGRWVRLTCSTTTRCATASGSLRSPSPSGAEAVILGRTEDGITLGHAITDPAHLGVQGQNGSGQVARSATGCSPSSPPPPTSSSPARTSPDCCSARAWDDTAHRPHQVTGTADIAAHAVLLEDLVAEMDRRLSAIPPRRDKIEPIAEHADGARGARGVPGPAARR